MLMVSQHGLGDAKEEVMRFLRNLPGGTSLVAGVEKLAEYIKDEAKAGAREAVRPYVYASLGVSALAGGIAIAALLRTRSPGLRGAGDLDGFTWCSRAVASKGSFDKRSFRWIKSGKGRVLIGCPKGHWKPRAKSCDVGTRAYKVYADRGGRCEPGERSVSKFSSFFTRTRS